MEKSDVGAYLVDDHHFEGHRSKRLSGKKCIWVVFIVLSDLEVVSAEKENVGRTSFYLLVSYNIKWVVDISPDAKGLHLSLRIR